MSLNPRLISIACALLVAAGCAEVAVSPDPVQESIAPDERVPDDQSHLATVLAELEQSESLPGWAGEYYAGDGRGADLSLWLAPDAGFVFQWNGCLGLVSENWGGIEIEGARVRLQCELANEPGTFGGLRTEYIHVPFGERNYLITPKEMLAFCKAVRMHNEPRNRRWGRFLMRAGDGKRPALGLPTVPEEFQWALESRLIHTRIVEVLGSEPGKYGTRTRVRLDLTSEQGAFRHMDLMLEEPVLDRVCNAFVESVDAAGCTALLYWDSEGPLPQIGWTFLHNPE